LGTFFGHVFSGTSLGAGGVVVTMGWRGEVCDRQWASWKKRPKTCRAESPKLGQVQSRERCGVRGWPTASPCCYVWVRPRAPRIRSIVPPKWAGGALPLADVCSLADMPSGLPAGARQGVERSALRLGQPEGLHWGGPREHTQRQRAYRQAWPLLDPPPSLGPHGGLGDGPQKADMLREARLAWRRRRETLFRRVMVTTRLPYVWVVVASKYLLEPTAVPGRFSKTDAATV
jgi:hypothetical protein